MDDIDTAIKVAKELGIKEIAPKVYEDLLQPSVQELGQGLVVVAKAISVSLAPLEATVWGYERIKEWLSIKLTKKLASKDPSTLQTPPLIVAGPALMNLAFAYDEAGLREMYVNLLSTSMDKFESEKAHPSYVQIIQQLSSDEAKILGGLKDFDLTTTIFYYNDNESIDSNSKTISSQFKMLCYSVGVSNVSQSDTYLDNLIRLRILAETKSTEARYVSAGGDCSGTWEPHISQDYSEIIEFTEYGYDFVKVCLGH